MTTKPQTSEPTGIEQAIQKAGSQTKLAALIGAKQQMVSYWHKAGIVGDVAMCAAIERETGVRCELLNPTADWATLRLVLCAPDRDAIDASDDTQPPVGGSSDKSKLAPLAI